MNIRWHKRAAAQLLQVEEYVLRNFGEYTRQEFMDEVEQATLLLAEMPIMGKTDPLFVHRKLTYRSFIVRRLNKIVYYVKDEPYTSLPSGTLAASRRIKPGRQITPSP